jgi:WD40 repeat protein
VELRRRDTLEGVRALEGLKDASALAFSPDGRWLAVATCDEQVLLFDVASHRITSAIEAGEWTGSLAFAPDGSALASACSFQGGAEVRLDRVTSDGDLEPIHSISRADCYTTP